VKAATATKLRFGLVGVANTLLDLGVYTVLMLVGVPMVVANFISTSAGMALSFTLNRNFTFRAKAGDTRTQLILFFAVTATGLWIVQPLMITLLSGFFDGLPAVLAVAGPKLAGLAFNLVWNFTWYSKLVFRQKQQPS
jgi:putative flippase GtrA